MHAESTARLQEYSLGGSSSEIHAAVLAAASPAPGLSWLDIGCGTGEVLRRIRDCHAPAVLTAIDVIDWLDDDLRDSVSLAVGAAEEQLPTISPADRVLLVESLEHLEAPWATLRLAARKVQAGGLLIVTTPNVTTIRHRLELMIRGQLTSFRPDYPSHLTPVLRHTLEGILSEEGLDVRIAYIVRDLVPLTGGRRFPKFLHRWTPRLTSLSLMAIGARARGR